MSNRPVLQACLTAALWTAAPSSGLAKEPMADLVIVNANVVTVDLANPRAEAFAVANGKFVAVGSSSEMEPFIGENTKLIDLEGKTVTPGFIDAHAHPRPLHPVLSRLGIVDLSPENVPTMDDLVSALREKALVTPKGHWVLGRGYQDTKLGRHPTRRDLDQATTEHPILIRHSSGHVSAVNSMALDLAQVTADTPDPPGGGFDRDDDGVPNGVCRESPAVNIIREAGPPLPTPTREEALEGMQARLRGYLSKGITGVGDAGIQPSKMRVYQDLVESGPTVRIYAMFREQALPVLKELRLRTGFGNERLRIGAIKIFHGNSLSGRTCWLYEPYAGRPDYFGIPPARSQEELDELIFEIHAAGFQAAVHSNGDREIDMVLDAIEKALEKLPKPNHRHRIEHASVVNPSILKRTKELGVVLAPHSYVYEHGDKMEEYGEARWGMMHANRSALELGIPVAGNSDHPVSAADPMLRIQSLVTRTSAEGKVYGAEQRLTVEQAIQVFTLGSAYASFEENIKGSITVGKLADFVVLSRDPARVSPQTIKDIEVESTFIGGERVYGVR